ncbi:TPA: hypothetical protein U1278_000754 [Streptococcus suis]|nr:hypothetical protein [Streptococcus suis]
MEETIFKLEGHNGDYFCLEGWPLSMGYSSDGGISIEANLYVSVGVFQINGAKVYLSTTLLEKLFQDLYLMHGSLSGQAYYKPQFDDELQFDISILKGGKLQLKGVYQEYSYNFSLMKFEMESDQTFLANSLLELKKFLGHDF